MELKPNNKKKSITRKGSSIFSRSASLLGCKFQDNHNVDELRCLVRSLFRKPSTVRMESIADNLKATPSEEELEKEVVEKERSQSTYTFRS